MPMDGDILAMEVLSQMGGKVTPARQKAFSAMCRAIIQHIQLYGVVQGTATGVTAGPTAVPVVGKVL